jgi:hypothetical protein
MKAKKSNMIPVLSTCNADLTSYGGFVWPRSGPVKCHDWESTYKCGHGLHGLPKGIGAGSVLNWSPDALWLVVMVDETVLLTGKDELVGKCKFPFGEVVFCGYKDEALAEMVKRGSDAALMVGGTATAGVGGMATAGYGGTATAGVGGTATAGDRGTATAGEGGILNIRYWDGNRYRIAVFYVGEDGIEANQKYCLNGEHKPEKVS